MTIPLENAVEVGSTLEAVTMIEVENAPHEALTIAAVQDVVAAFFSGADVGGSIVAPAPQFLTVSQALQPNAGSPRR